MTIFLLILFIDYLMKARVAQSVEHGANNARVAGSKPAVSIFIILPFLIYLSLFFLLFSASHSSYIIIFLFDSFLNISLPQYLKYIYFYFTFLTYSLFIFQCLYFQLISNVFISFFLLYTFLFSFLFRLYSFNP